MANWLDSFPFERESMFELGQSEKMQVNDNIKNFYNPFEKEKNKGIYKERWELKYRLQEKLQQRPL